MHPTLSTLESHWVAEIIRLQELSTGPMVDEPLHHEIGKLDGNIEQRILVRASRLAQREGIIPTITAWRTRIPLLLLGLSLFALLAGFGIALTVLGDGSRPVNVIWALGGLLGIHFLSLLLWAAGFWLGGRDSPGIFGHIWLWLSTHLFARQQITTALISLLNRHGLMRWWLGAITHGLWLLMLLGALIGLLITLAVRQYGFIWETTILPAEFFVQFIQTIGWLPGQLGFAIPDTHHIHSGGTGMPATEAARVAWASWLVGGVVVYGILLRLLLWMLCFGIYKIRCNRLQLDLNLPGYIKLVQNLSPTSERIGVTDVAPSSLPHAHVAQTHFVGNHTAVLVGLELRADWPWPPALPAGVSNGGIIETREQRHRSLKQLAASPPARLLIACDPRLTPDRGSLELIAELSRYAGSSRVWLLSPPSGENAVRRGHWLESLQEIGMGSSEVFESQQQALMWLGGGNA